MSQSSPASKNYSVHHIDASITLTGNGDLPAWSKASVLEDFVYPWDTGTPPKTSFQALHSDDWIYLLFQVDDNDIHVLAEKNNKAEVVNGDRVEVFFRINQQLSPYYCLEIDPLGRVLDYKAIYHRKFDMAWSWPEGHLVTRATRSAHGYTVEIGVSKQSLNTLGLLKGNRMEAGIFRANCTAIGESNMKWISWMKPDSPTADFHIPSAFGVLVLND